MRLPCSDITVEHIFPQTPSHAWKKHMSDEEFKEMKEIWIHTIGNLTLSGNNGSLGNKDFIQKRDIPEKGYRDSRLWLNKYLSEIDTWNKNFLKSRFEILLDRFLTIWAYPEVDISDDDEMFEEVNIFDAEEPTHKKLDYAVLFGQKLKIKTVASLYIEVFTYLFEQNPEVFFNTDLAERVGLLKYHNKEKLRSPKAISSSYFIETNLDSRSKFDRIKYALEVFEAEDELSIKYAVES